MTRTTPHPLAELVMPTISEEQKELWRWIDWLHRKMWEAAGIPKRYLDKAPQPKEHRSR